MARIINTNSPGKRRSAHMRTIAELLRLLSQQQNVNPTTKDMVAAIVFNLRAISGTVEESVVAWEKRGYWKKADDFQQKWWWCELMALSIETLIRDDDWDQLPAALAKLFPHYADINVSKLTRKADSWQGRYAKLMAESVNRSA